MAKTTEATFGAKLANAATLSTHLKSFIGYLSPTAETSIVQYDLLIESIKTTNGNVISRKANYSTAVETRLKHFSKEASSVDKLISPILATVRATLGKSAKEVATITAIAIKIRGDKTSKAKSADKGNGISHSELSYGSKTQNFADIVNILVGLGANYKPANDLISITSLQTKIAEINQANTVVASSYGALKVVSDFRNSQYEQLAEITQRIKEAVKSQYGVSSVEYQLVKGLKV